MCRRAVCEKTHSVLRWPLYQYGHGLPERIRAFCPGLPAALAFALRRGGAARAWRLRPRRVIERRIQRRHETIVTWLFTPANASETAAKPPSTTKTSGRPGSQRRACRISCRTSSTLVLCRRGMA